MMGKGRRRESWEEQGEAITQRKTDVECQERKWKARDKEMERGKEIQEDRGKGRG